MRPVFYLAYLFIYSTVACAVPANEIPLYGDVPKSAAERAADASFVAEVSKLAGSRERAADQFLEKGWKALSANDPTTAVKRFNQAYLLAPKKSEVYWGLAVASATKGEHPTAYRLFDEALKLDPENARLLCDYGHAKVNEGLREIEAAKDPKSPRAEALFVAAHGFYVRAIARSPKSALPHSRLAMLSFYRADYKLARDEVAKAQLLGGEGLDPRFLAALKLM